MGPPSALGPPTTASRSPAVRRPCRESLLQHSNIVEASKEPCFFHIIDTMAIFVINFLMQALVSFQYLFDE